MSFFGTFHLRFSILVLPVLLWLGHLPLSGQNDSTAFQVTYTPPPPPTAEQRIAELPQFQPGRVLTQAELDAEPWYTNLRDALKNPEKVYKLALSKNRLRGIPMEVLVLRNLQVLQLDRNRIRQLPDELASLQNLQELDLLGNNLSALPENIGQLRELTKLYLGRNRLFRFPVSIVGLRKLRVLDVTQNPLTLHEIEFVQKRLPVCRVLSN
jgi:Leucine-rich repeat (LRR) protein